MSDPSSVTHVTIRQARTFLAVARNGSITAAAKSISRSQTSVTKVLQELELQLSASLFDRSSKGVTPTAFGKAFEIGALGAEREFQAAAQLLPPAEVAGSPSIARFFRMDVSDKWLDSFLATAEQQSLSGAAQDLAVTTTAISANVRKLEESLDRTLFERNPTAMLPTSFSRALIRHVKLAKSYLRHASEGVLSMRGVTTGEVRFGSLPFMRTRIVPHAIAMLRITHPYMRFSTYEGAYSELVAALRCGDIDFMVGALRNVPDDYDLVEERLLDERISIIVRTGHPLQVQHAITWSDLIRYKWILPRPKTASRILFDDMLVQYELTRPEHVVETSSTILLRGLLVEDDFVSIFSRSEIYYEEKYGILTTLDFDLPQAPRPIGITRRAHTSLPPAAELLIATIRDAVHDSDQAQ
ncbi:MAG TPA: LysR family transcriptional regulator [Woeseiaceae bacterium]|nr:LysR family transcriptional regulator [Woeseiaceae bacterium]